MRIFVTVLLLSLGTLITVLFMGLGNPAIAECDKLCSNDWWQRATTSDVRIKLEAGENVMASNNDGWTSLHYAVAYGTPEGLKVLLDAGADVMARDRDGWTPLHLATGRRVYVDGSVEALLEAGADPQAKDGYGKTAWDYAQDNEALKDTNGYWALNDAK